MFEKNQITVNNLGLFEYLLENFIYLCLKTLFFLMLFSPRTNQTIKYPFLIIITCFSLLNIFQTGIIKLHKKIFLWFLIYINYGFLWGFYGLINGKEFAIDFIRLNSAWPIIFFFLILVISKPKHIEMCYRVMIWATLAISIYNINYVLFTMKYIHIPVLINLEMGQRIGIHPGYIQLTAHNIGSLGFLFPFIFCGIVVTKKKLFVGVSKNLLYITFIACLIATIISGRRMMWIIGALTVIIYAFIIYIIRGKINRNIIKVIIISIIILIIIFLIFYNVMGWEVGNLIDRMTFSEEHDLGIEKRINRIKFLINEVYEKNVLIGTGGGNKAFEIIFINKLNETGIIGLFLFLSLFFWVYNTLVKLLKKGNADLELGLPLIVGSIGFFLSMLTNPYFSSFDFMWTLFLPVAFINIYIKKNDD